ncbi:MAG: branched-chain amino acid aminotransferase [Bacteroidetes bacterium]|nr:branched-chain amino acid aminotransferase [Bacteroidota bacterium]MDA1268239.1 branched-chain amino acid aminotransferase [Bacteroidota bacterium]
MMNPISISITKSSNSKIPETNFSSLVFGKTFSDHIFVSDYQNGAWGDFRIVPYGPIDIYPSNASLHYGQTIFEGLKAYKNEYGKVLIFRPEANARRLNESAIRMCMPPLPEDIFMEALRQLLTLDQDWVPKEKGSSLYIRPFMFAMDNYLGVKPSDSYRFMIFTSPVGAYYTKPVSVKVETSYTRATEGGTGEAKAGGNYAASLYPALQAQNEGYDQLLWTDGKTHSHIEESGTMNVVFKIKGTLITAPTTKGTILKGITRDSVLQLAKDWRQAVEERFLTVTELQESLENGSLEEAFGLGTAATIAFIDKIHVNGKDYFLTEPSQEAFSKRALKTLDGIKYGDLQDPHQWMLSISKINGKGAV